MKILLINNFHYRKGGSEAVYFNTAELLRAHGHEVVFFAFDDAQNQDCPWRNFFVTHRGGIGGLADYFYNREAARKLEELVKAEKPDIAHVHLFWGGLSPSIFGVLKRHGIPLVHTCHDYRLVCPGYTFRDGKGRVCERCRRGNYYQCALHRCAKGSLVRSLVMAAEMYVRQLFFNPLKNIAGFVFVSHFSEQKHLQHHPAYKDKKQMVLYNYTTPVLEPALAEKENYVLFYGRLSAEKGVQTLMKAADRLPDVRFKVVGTGPLEESLKASAPGNVEFLGYKAGEELYRVVRDARFVCVPSEWYENNPMTIIEAYSLGTPVVGADIGGIPEIIEEGKTGFLIPPGDVSALKDVLEKAFALADNDYKNMCLEAYNCYHRNFSAENYYQKLIHFYNEL